MYALVREDKRGRSKAAIAAEKTILSGQGESTSPLVKQSAPGHGTSDLSTEISWSFRFLLIFI